MVRGARCDGVTGAGRSGSVDGGAGLEAGGGEGGDVSMVGRYVGGVSGGGTHLLTATVAHVIRVGSSPVRCVRGLTRPGPMCRCLPTFVGVCRSASRAERPATHIGHPRCVRSSALPLAPPRRAALAARLAPLVPRPETACPCVAVSLLRCPRSAIQPLSRQSSVSSSPFASAVAAVARPLAH